MIDTETRWRVLVDHNHGVSERIIARARGLSRRRIRAILAEWRGVGEFVA